MEVNQRRGRPVKYLTAEEKEAARTIAKSRASKKYYEKKSVACCEKQRNYYEQHREEILQRIRENRPERMRGPGRPRKIIEV
jgi:hypothetical protein